MKTLTKKQLANLLNISNSTLQNYLNRLWFNKLKETGYQKRNKILSIKQLSIIKDILGDFENSDE